MSVIEDINSIINQVKNTMKALKTALLVGLGAGGAYVANEAISTTGPATAGEVTEQVKPSEESRKDDVATVEIPAPVDEPVTIGEVGAKPLILYRVYFAWDYAVEIPEEVVPVKVSAPGRPSYDINVRIPGHTIEVPLENTSFNIATRFGPPTEKEALKVIKARGEKLIPPRDGGKYAGLVRVEVLGERRLAGR